MSKAHKRRWLVRAAVVVALAAVSCNALLGNDEGTFDPLDAGGIDAMMPDAAVDGAPKTLDVTTTRREIRLPRGRTTTVTFTIAGATDAPKPRVEGLPVGVTVTGASVAPDGKSARIVLTSAEDTAAVATMVAFHFDGADRSGVAQVALRVAPPGTLDTLFGSAGIVDVVRSSVELVLPDLVLTRGTKAYAVVNPGVGRPNVSIFGYADDGTPDKGFGDAGVVALLPADSACRSYDARLDGDAVVVLARCPSGTFVWRIELDGKANALLADASLVASPVGVVIADAGISIVLLDREAGALEQRGLDASLLQQAPAVDLEFAQLIDTGKNLVIGGYETDAGRGAVVALDRNFVPDGKWGDGGILPLPQLDAPILTTSTVLAENGGVFVLGVPHYPGSLETRLVKISGAGAPDDAFPLSQLLRQKTGGRTSLIGMDDRGRVVLGNFSDTSLPSFERFTSSGVRDPSFGIDGGLALTIDCVPTWMATDEDGMLVVLCFTLGDALLRIWP